MVPGRSRGSAYCTAFLSRSIRSGLPLQPARNALRRKQVQKMARRHYEPVSFLPAQGGARMTRQVPIQINVGSALRWLGTVYRNASDALKEHISNAIDEHLKAQKAGFAQPYCDVLFTLEKRFITIDYPYGMDKSEFEHALQRVADSAKKSSDIAQIGRLGIGMFSFQQIGGKCTFFCRKSAEVETICVTLKEGSDKAQ